MTTVKLNEKQLQQLVDSAYTMGRAHARTKVRVYEDIPQNNAVELLTLNGVVLDRHTGCDAEVI